MKDTAGQRGSAERYSTFLWDWDSDGHDGIRSHAGAEERTMLFSLIQHERERRISLYRE